MTVKNVIDRADALRPNGCTDAQKLEWVKTLETIIFDELISTHLMPQSDRPDENFNAQSVLAAPETYGSDVYIKWLICCVDFFNGESERFNQSVGLMNSAWRQLCDYINRTYMPKGLKLYI